MEGLKSGSERQALSANSLSHADMPLGFAFFLYDAFSAAVQRKCTCSVARSLAGRVGLPLRLVDMPLIVDTKIALDKPADGVLNVYTLNKEAQMKSETLKLALEMIAEFAIPVVMSLALLAAPAAVWIDYASRYAR